MEQKIKSFHQDEEQHWVADLTCGHKQHVRHDPPWNERPWVITEEGRKKYIGTFLNCVVCDEMGERVAKAIIEKCKATLISSYEDAGVSGLCEEGRWEIALSSLDNLPIKEIIKVALNEE